MEHRPENKKHLAANIAEIVEFDALNSIEVDDMLGLLNGKDDGVSWDVTEEELVTALEDLVRVGVLRRLKKGHYRVRADYAKLRDRGEDLDIRAMVAK